MANQAFTVCDIFEYFTGFGAAKHLAKQGYDLTLLEASPNPGGLSTGFRTKKGNAVEAGMKGFWYQVGWKEIEALCRAQSPDQGVITQFVCLATVTRCIVFREQIVYIESQV